MCGIVGIFSFRGKPLKNLKTRISKMTTMLKHRGPDQQGIFVSEDNLCAIGNTRLSIVDPNCKQKLPLRSNNMRFLLAFNGEIFNYKYLKKYLQNKGVNFKTNTDTEVLLEGLVLEGISYLSKLEGMWAFGLYDEKEKRLVLSRDLMGERHLFYCIHDDILYFSSEPLPIVTDIKKNFKIDDESIVNAMLFNSCPPGETLIKDIKRLLPGRNIITEINKYPTEILFNKLNPEKWFDFFSSEPSTNKIFETFSEICADGMSKRLPTDVAYATSLSGGIDSAIIALYASKFGKKKLDSIFIKDFNDVCPIHSNEISEDQAAHFTSSKLNISLRNIDFDHQENIKDLLEASENSFDGMFDCSFIIFRQLAREMKTMKKKVILMADGLDELQGYPTDHDAFTKNEYFNTRKFKLFFFTQLSKSRYIKSFLRRLGMENFIVDFPKTNDFCFPPLHALASSDFVKKIISPKKFKNLIYSFGTIDPMYNDIKSKLDFGQKMSLSYCTKSLPDWFNLRSDKGFFGHSIECRLPFQDPKLVEFLISFPSKLRYFDNDVKVFARKIVRQFIGTEVSSRNKNVPPFSSRCLNIYEKKLKIEETLKESNFFNHFPFKKDIKKKLFNSKYGFNKFYWTLYCLSKTNDKLKKINNDS